MTWNWQQPDWPNFTYDANALVELEAKFQRQAGVLIGALRHLSDSDQEQLKLELITLEGMKTSAIEGVCLDRDSLELAIRRELGLEVDSRNFLLPEQGIADMLVDAYNGFAAELNHEKLHSWHIMVTRGRTDLDAIGRYREHSAAMHIVSRSDCGRKVHFEAPPSVHMNREMTRFLGWFNGSMSMGALVRAAIAHLYFISIHPYEDGNGRIARVIADKSIAQSIGQPTLTGLASQIEHRRVDYYNALGTTNQSNEVTEWVLYFAGVVLAAQQKIEAKIEFLIFKTRFFERLRGQLNTRQQSVLDCMFREGIDGFKDGLSADLYARISQTSSATATRDLKKLVSLEALTRTGTLKGTRYWLAGVS